MEQTFDSRTRLLDAAESLFADKGLQATSIRDITNAAQTNLAAVNYHFRSKEGLIAAVLERRAAPVNAVRLRNLAELERQANGSALPIEDILRAFLQPVWDTMRTNPPFMRFASRMISEPDPALREILLTEFREVAQRFHAALRLSLPTLEPPELWLGFGMIIAGISYICTNRNDVAIITGGRATAPALPDLLEPMIRFMAAGLRAMEVA